MGKLNSDSIASKVYITGVENPDQPELVNLATETGISKTVLNRNGWNQIKNGCRFVKTSKRFRPHGTSYYLPIKGKAKVILTAERGATIETWVYVNNDPNEQSLLGEKDAIQLGIVTLNPLGAENAVTEQRTPDKLWQTSDI